MEGNTMKAQASPRLAEARIRQAEALLMRASGHSFESVAHELGYGSRASAFKAVKRGMDATRDRAAVAYRVLLYLRFEGQLDTLDALLEAGRYGEVLRLLEDRIARAEQGFWEAKRWGAPPSYL